MDGSRTGNREREIEGEDRRSIHLQDKSIGRCQRWNSKLSEWYKIRCVLCTGKLATTPPSTPTPFSTVDQGNQAAKNSKTVVRRIGWYRVSGSEMTTLNQRPGHARCNNDAVYTPIAPCANH